VVKPVEMLRQIRAGIVDLARQQILTVDLPGCFHAPNLLPFSTVPFAVADEEINDVFGAGLAVLPVETCSLHEQPSGLCASDDFGELFDGAMFDHWSCVS